MRTIQKTISGFIGFAKTKCIYYITKLLANRNNRRELIKKREHDFDFGATHRPKLLEIIFQSHKHGGIGTKTTEVPLPILSPLNTTRDLSRKSTADMAMYLIDIHTGQLPLSSGVVKIIDTVAKNSAPVRLREEVVNVVNIQNNKVTNV